MTKKPKISPDFTIDDIHKIREWHNQLCEEMGEEAFKKWRTERVQEIIKDFPKLKVLTSY